MKRIRVPEEMLKAALDSFPQEPFEMSPLVAHCAKERVPRILEAALLWLSEEAEKLKKQDTTKTGESMYAYDRRSGYNAALDDVVRLFSEPEPKDNPVVRGVVDRFRGVTLSRSEADYIIDQINMVTHG